MLLIFHLSRTLPPAGLHPVLLAVRLAVRPRQVPLLPLPLLVVHLPACSPRARSRPRACIAFSLFVSAACLCCRCRSSLSTSPRTPAKPSTLLPASLGHFVLDAPLPSAVLVERLLPHPPRRRICGDCTGLCARGPRPALLPLAPPVHLPTHSRRAKHASARGPGTFCASRRAARAMNAAVLNRWPTPTPSSASNVE